MILLLFQCIPVPIYYNFRHKESEEKIMSALMLTFTPLKFFDLL
jgi:hypothetical protein